MEAREPAALNAAREQDKMALKDYAAYLRFYFDGLTEAGFSEEQAFKLVEIATPTFLSLQLFGDPFAALQGEEDEP